ncbi:MAG: RnfABCDGE type electron transport complex subunit D [Spirochaetales bacterium]
MDETMIITGTPQIFDRPTTGRMIWTVSFWLVPVAGWGIYLYGIGAFKILLASILTSLLAEGTVGVVRKESTLQDGSAFLTGLLIGMLLPPTVPLFIPVLAALFSQLVVKWSFGGLGRNWMNPALAGWAFVSLSFPDQMRTWLIPAMVKGVDTVTSSTPLAFLKHKVFLEGVKGVLPMEILTRSGFPRSLIDQSWTDWLNTNLLHRLGILLPYGYIDLFLGFTPGTIGEGAAFLILLGTVALIAKGILPWEVPLSVFSVFGALVFFFGGLPYGLGLESGDVLFHVFSGGFLLGTFYMATDLVTTPLTRTGLFLYGGGIGGITFLIRMYGGTAEGIGYAILFMNVFVPLLNRFLEPRPKKKD